jgi:sec-independent protein translocase protein TatC
MSTKSEMSFWDHLEVLRWMLIRVLAVWTVCMLLGFVFVPYLFEQVVMAPCRDDFFLYQLIKQTAARSWIVPIQVPAVNRTSTDPGAWTDNLCAPHIS